MHCLQILLYSVLKTLLLRENGSIKVVLDSTRHFYNTLLAIYEDVKWVASNSNLHRVQRYKNSKLLSCQQIMESEINSSIFVCQIMVIIHDIMTHKTGFNKRGFASVQSPSRNT
jgi:hypothetical protein